MHDFSTKTVREIALEIPQSSRVFEHYHIDYCCKGGLLLVDACNGANLDPEAVIGDINAVAGQASPPGEEKVASWSLTQLIQHIVDKHHRFTYAEVENLPLLAKKVASRHGDHIPKLHELKQVLALLCDHLIPHMMKEEQVLFPYIQQLESAEFPALPPFGTVLNPVRTMRSDHESVGHLLARMRELTDDYVLPDQACPSFTALYHRLEALERDLHQHIHLENNLLFPGAERLEENLFASTIGT